jgi:hypothetical protein
VTALHQVLTGRRLHIFLSYAREDLAVLRSVQEGLVTLNHEVWFDKRLNGGQDWWDRILQRIRDCDVMIVAVSPAMLESDAAAREREYACRLGKPLLPVQVDPVLPDLLPPEIAELHIVDYTNLGPMTGFELAAALAALPSASPLPDPLPDPPRRPVPPLAELAQRINAERLSLDDQLALVASLRFEIDRARERTTAMELLRTMQRRRDLYHATWQELDELMQRERGLHGEDGPHSPPTNGHASAPEGWYPDPSGRHQFRWFEGDWTSYASDAGTVIDDPDF